VENTFIGKSDKLLQDSKAGLPKKLSHVLFAKFIFIKEIPVLLDREVRVPF